MHGHGSVRVERVRSGVFWDEASGCAHLQAFGSNDSNDVGCADGAEAMIGGIIADGGGGITPLAVQAEEDVDACIDWSGCGGLGTEVGYGLAADGILLIVESEENLSGLCSAGAPLGRKNSLTKNTNSMRGRNWNVRRWPVHFVYLQERR